MRTRTCDVQSQASPARLASKRQHVVNNVVVLPLLLQSPLFALSLGLCSKMFVRKLTIIGLQTIKVVGRHLAGESIAAAGTS